MKVRVRLLKPVDDEVKIAMTKAEAKELCEQMEAFWAAHSVGRQKPSGDSPFARLWDGLQKAMKR